jgi:integral membrane protein
MIEAVSFLVLLLVAMPLKYLLGKPEVVLYVGWVHGVLFMTYAAVTFVAWGQGHLHFRMVCLAALASILPGGPFFIDKKLKFVEKTEEISTTA